MSGPSGGLTGNLVKGRWKVIRKIGQGAFGEIYSGRNVITSELVAIKVERVDSQKQVLKLEVAVVKKLQTCPYVVKFVSCGCHNEYNYMVMELLGDNISELRRRQPNVTGSFSMQTTLKLGLQMLRAIEAVHDLGFLHRDIKPSNFAMGLSPSKRHSCYMIDFGLSRRYLLPDGTVRPQREQTGFRGTARYASINSHLSKDLSRRDDLWSLFYLLIEFANGQLPWRRIKDKDKVGEMKLEMDNAELVAGLPHEFLLFMQHLQSLSYEDRPNYNYLRGLLTDLYTSIGGTDDTPFDWEVSTPHTPIVRPRPLPTLLDLCFVKVAINIQQYKQLRLPFSLKKRMLNLIIRTGNGNWPRSSAKQLLDENIQELDVSKCRLEEEDSLFLSKTCTQLRSLNLGLSDDNLLRLFLCSNTKLEQLSMIGSKALTVPKGLKVVEALTNLHSFKISNHDRITDKHLSTILKTCNKITDLSVVNCKKVRGLFFKSFAAPKRIYLNLTNLDLSLCPLSKKAFKYLSKTCSSIQTLRLFPLTTKARFSILDFTNVLHYSKNLSVLYLGLETEMDPILIEVSRYCHKLTGLILRGHELTDYGLQNVVHSCPSLDTLQFQINDGLTNATLYQIAKTCTSLKKLAIDFGKGERSSISVPAVNALLQSSTVLNELSLKRCGILSVECFRDGCFVGLKALNLSHCVQLSDSAVRHIVETCPNLTSLGLNNLNNLTFNALESVSLCCPSLEELHIKQCPCFTDDHIKAILKFLPKLFVKVTRYAQGNGGEILETNIEVHSATVNDLFEKYKNPAREVVLSRVRVTKDENQYA